MKRLDAVLAHRSMGLVLFVTCLLVWAMLTKVHTHSWQEESRMATIQALVEQDTFVIDHTEFNRTGDKVFVNGHFYSDKTPILSVAAAGVYSILHNIFGLTLDPTICVPDQDPAACRVFGPEGTRFTAFYWLTLIFSGGSSALLVVVFWKAMIDCGVGGTLATALAVALGFASPIAPYSIVFAGHVPAAVCLFAGFLLLARYNAVQRKRNTFWAGLLISLSANIDLTLAVFIVAFALWILLARRSRLLLFLVGALVPFAVSGALNYWAAGTLVPLYFDPKAYDFFGTVLNPTVGGTNGFYSLDFGLRYAYAMLIGRRGLFAFTPMLIYAVMGIGIVVRERSNRLRGLTIAAGLGCLIFTAYLILRTDNFGGAAWGTRWFVPLIPVLWYFSYRAYGVVSGAYYPARIWRIVFWGIVILSFFTAALGLQDAWRDVPPIIHL